MKSIQDYGFRLYNPSIARFLSVDPLSPQYPWYTPYQFAGNMPIRYIDRDGLEPATPFPYWNREWGKYKGNFRVDGIWVHEKFDDSANLEYHWYSEKTREWKEFTPNPITQTTAKDVELIAAVSVGATMLAGAGSQSVLVKAFSPKLFAFNMSLELGSNALFKHEFNADVFDATLGSIGGVGFWWQLGGSSLIDIDLNGNVKTFGGLAGEEKAGGEVLTELFAGAVVKGAFEGVTKLNQVGWNMAMRGDELITKGLRNNLDSPIYGEGWAHYTGGFMIAQGKQVTKTGEKLIKMGEWLERVKGRFGGGDNLQGVTTEAVEGGAKTMLGF